MSKQLAVGEIFKRLRVDVDAGRAYWIDATRHHRHLVGQEAGCRTRGRAGKDYWVIRINGTGYKRSHIIFAVKTGAWPTEQVDHIDGNSLNDAGTNLRHASQQENCWNHKTRKKASGLPMGVRQVSKTGYMARIAVNKKSINLGTFPTADQASAAYHAARLANFGEFA